MGDKVKGRSPKNLKMLVDVAKACQVKGHVFSLKFSSPKKLKILKEVP